MFGRIFGPRARQRGLTADDLVTSNLGLIFPESSRHQFNATQRQDTRSKEEIPHVETSAARLRRPHDPAFDPSRSRH
jgi:hypothetical protein